MDGYQNYYVKWNKSIHNVWFHLYGPLPKTNTINIDWMEIGGCLGQNFYAYGILLIELVYILILTLDTEQYKFVKLIDMYSKKWYIL